MPATAPLAPCPPRTTVCTPPAVVTLHTVGECRIVVTHAAGMTALTPASDRLFTLTLLLAAEAGRPVPRARIAAWLWPDLPATAARHALRQLLYRLRRLGVTVDGDDAHLALAPRCVTRPTTARDGGTPPTGRCLPGWDPPGEALGAWVDRYRATVDGATRAALARALEEAHAANRDAFVLAAALLELDPRHPLARATLPRPRAVRETPSPAPALPCIGRNEVLHMLYDRATAVRDGHGATVVLAAASGAGASRLLGELTVTARELGVAVATAPDASAAPGTLARTLAAIVRTLLDRPGALGCSPDTLRALRRFTTTPLLPAGDTTVRRLGAAIAELARAIAGERSLLLTVDAQCRAPEERALAAAIARALDGAAVLAIFVAPVGPASLGSFGILGAAAHVATLPPLTNDDAARLATAALLARGSPPSPDDVAWCVAMANGRPGDVIALANACAARPGTRELPAPIATRLRGHVAALPPRTRQVAALRTLLGDIATPDVISRTLGRHPAAVHAALAELRRAGLPGALHDDARPSHEDATRIVGAMVLATFDADDRAGLSRRAAAVLQPPVRASPANSASAPSSVRPASP